MYSSSPIRTTVHVPMRQVTTTSLRASYQKLARKLHIFSTMLSIKALQDRTLDWGQIWQTRFPVRAPKETDCSRFYSFYVRRISVSAVLRLGYYGQDAGGPLSNPSPALGKDSLSGRDANHASPQESKIVLNSRVP